MATIPAAINGVTVRFNEKVVNDVIKAIVDSIQTTFESYSHRRENFGPLFKRKLGKDHPVKGHQDHIHLSVD